MTKDEALQWVGKAFYAWDKLDIVVVKNQGQKDTIELLNRSVKLGQIKREVIKTLQEA